MISMLVLAELITGNWDCMFLLFLIYTARLIAYQAYSHTLLLGSNQQVPHKNTLSEAINFRN